MSHPDGPSERADVSKELWERFQQSMQVALSNTRDPETMAQAAAAMDRLGEQIRQREGVLDIVMPIVREMRGE